MDGYERAALLSDYQTLIQNHGVASLQCSDWLAKQSDETLLEFCKALREMKMELTNEKKRGKLRK